MDLFKQLFCKHDYVHWDTIHGDEIVYSNGMRSIEKCTKCEKTRYTKNLYIGGEDKMAKFRDAWEEMKLEKDMELHLQKANLLGQVNSNGIQQYSDDYMDAIRALVENGYTLQEAHSMMKPGGMLTKADTRYNKPKEAPKASKQEVYETIGKTEIYRRAKLAIVQYENMTKAKRDVILAAQDKQVAYGLDKYPEPLNAKTWSVVETIDHILDESIDKLHYLIMLRIKMETELTHMNNQLKGLPHPNSVIENLIGMVENLVREMAYLADLRIQFSKEEQEVKDDAPSIYTMDSNGHFNKVSVDSITKVKPLTMDQIKKSIDGLKVNDGRLASPYDQWLKEMNIIEPKPFIPGYSMFDVIENVNKASDLSRVDKEEVKAWAGDIDMGKSTVQKDTTGSKVMFEDIKMPDIPAGKTEPISADDYIRKQKEAIEHGLKMAKNFPNGLPEDMVVKPFIQPQIRDTIKIGSESIKVLEDGKILVNGKDINHIVTHSVYDGFHNVDKIYFESVKQLEQAVNILTRAIMATNGSTIHVKGE